MSRLIKEGAWKGQGPAHQVSGLAGGWAEPALSWIPCYGLASPLFCGLHRSYDLPWVLRLTVGDDMALGPATLLTSHQEMSWTQLL